MAEAAYVQGDSVFVMVLRKTVAANPAGFADEKDKLAQRIGAEKQQRAMRRLIENLKANARIEIHPDFI